MNKTELAIRNKEIRSRSNQRKSFFDSKEGKALNSYAQKVLRGEYLRQNLNILNRMGASPEAFNEALGMFGFGGITKAGTKLYHGTNKVFKEFDIKQSADGSIWFTDKDLNPTNQPSSNQISTYLISCRRSH